jgi:hypothetical protein
MTGKVTENWPELIAALPGDNCETSERKVDVRQM